MPPGRDYQSDQAFHKAQWLYDNMGDEDDAEASEDDLSCLDTEEEDREEWLKGRE